MASSAGFLKYIQKAFTYHWNLLAVGAGVVLGVVSGRPDIVIPLIAAGEVAFLAGLSTHPRFRAATKPTRQAPDSSNQPNVLARCSC